LRKPRFGPQVSLEAASVVTLVLGACDDPMRQYTSAGRRYSVIIA
jgi:hypothetical protein